MRSISSGRGNAETIQANKHSFDGHKPRGFAFTTRVIVYFATRAFVVVYFATRAFVVGYFATCNCLPVKMPDCVFPVLYFFEDSRHREGHQPLCGEGQVQRERGWVV